MSGDRVSNKWLLGAALFATATMVGRGALGAEGKREGESGKEKGGGVEAGGTLSLGGGGGAVEATGDQYRDRPAEGASGKEGEEGPFRVGLDMVLGFGRVNTANQTLPGTLGAGGGVTSIDPARVNTESFILSGGVEIKHIGLGARLPLAFGSVDPHINGARGTSALGNLELEGEYEYEINEQMALIPALGVTLPTGQGTEVPEDPAQLNVDPRTGFIDQNSYDRFAVNRAAASARGFEDNALFEPLRFGIIPKISLNYHTAAGLVVVPYLKLENLIDTSGHADKGYLGELVPGIRVAYKVTKQLEPGLRIWGNIGFSQTNPKPVAVAEPELRMHFGDITPLVGIILPVAGPLTDPYFLGIQGAVAAAF